jgi:RNA polymerase sigma-70 factor (ECF subfamily)
MPTDSTATCPDAAQQRAFLDLAADMRPALCSVALRIVKDEEDADDVVQDSYLRAWRALPGFRGDSLLSTWLHSIVVNRALTHIASRRRHRHEVLPDDGSHDPVELRVSADPALAAESGADREELVAALGQLPRQSREVIVLREIHGLSHEEIARSVGISVTASKVRLHRARLRLRQVVVEAERVERIAG